MKAGDLRRFKDTHRRYPGASFLVLEVEDLNPKVGDLWRMTKPVIIAGYTHPAGTIALIIKSKKQDPEWPGVFVMTILVDGRQHSVYSNSDYWEHVDEAG